MEQQFKWIIYFFIISSKVDYLWSRPTTTTSFEVDRKQRQVVQPTWLNRPEFFFSDSKVKVTDKSLKEAAEIRESIQKAVKSGTFAVDSSKPSKPIPVIESSDSPQQPAFWNFDFSKFDFSKFDFSKFDFSQWDFNFFTEEQKVGFAKEMLRIWDQFLEFF